MKGSSKDKDICNKINNFIDENKLKIIRNGNPPRNKQKIEPEILEIIKNIEIDEEKDISKKLVKKNFKSKQAIKYKLIKSEWQRKKDQINPLKIIEEESEGSEESEGLENSSYKKLSTTKPNRTL